MVEPTIEKLHQLKQRGIGPYYMRMDNAGENISLQKIAESADWKLGLQCEYTARDTPQQNALAEIAFTTLGGRAKAMLNQANVPAPKRHLLISKAIKAATLLDGLTLITIDGVTKTRYEHCLEKFRALPRTSEFGAKQAQSP